MNNSVHKWSESSYFIPISNCVPTVGYLRSTICDLQRGSYSFIPNDMANLIKSGANYKVADLLGDKIVASKELLEEYMDFLERNEYAIWVDEEEISWFPPLDLEWDIPQKITNTSIDVGESIPYSLEMLATLLVELNCQNIQFYSKMPHHLSFWNNILEHFVDSRVKYIEIITPEGPYLKSSEKELKSFFERNRRLINMTIYNSQEGKIVDYSKKQRLVYINQNLISNSGESLVHPASFISNISLFTESQHYNNYYNRKLHIDSDGSIKNASELPKSFGKIQTFNNIEKITGTIESKNFRRLWNVKKDDCDVCKFCEFRYLCVDNRVPKRRSDTEWYFDIECNYNPFIARWKHENHYRNLSQCGIISDTEEFYIDHKRVDNINEEIWNKNH